MLLQDDTQGEEPAETKTWFLIALTGPPWELIGHWRKLPKTGTSYMIQSRRRLSAVVPG